MHFDVSSDAHPELAAFPGSWSRTAPRSAYALFGRIDSKRLRRDNLAEFESHCYESCRPSESDKKKCLSFSLVYVPTVPQAAYQILSLAYLPKLKMRAESHAPYDRPAFFSRPFAPLHPTRHSLRNVGGEKMFTHCASIVFLGIATNLDNVCVGMAYGFSGKKIRTLQNLLVSFISGTFTLLACLLAQVISKTYIHLAGIFGALLLVTLGIYTIFSSFCSNTSCQEEPVRSTSIREMATLGIALAMNCLTASFALGMNQINGLGLGLCVMAFSLVAVGVGNRLGIRTKRMIRSSILNFTSGILLIAMGTWEFFI